MIAGGGRPPPTGLGTGVEDARRLPRHGGSAHRRFRGLAGPGGRSRTRRVIPTYLHIMIDWLGIHIL